jgi:hypothetical protein
LRRVPEIALGAMLATAIWVVVLLFALDPSTYHQICETDQYGHERCAPHNLLYVGFWYFSYIINAGTITALATGFIAWFTLTLKRSTDRLWDAGERQLQVISDNADQQSRDMAASVAETRRIGEAQVRAYVSIKTAVIAYMGEWQHPVVGFVALNTGQSPAKNLVWNIAVQYASGGQKRTVGVRPNWANEEIGFDIPAATESVLQRVGIANISLKAFRDNPGGAAMPHPRIVIVRVKVDFRYTDVFERDWFGEAYFHGIGPPPVGPTAPMDFPKIEQMTPLGPTSKPNDWDGPDNQ